jgi:hypothetical protein
MFYFLLDENIHILDSVVDFFGEVCVILPTVFHCVIAEALHLVLICGSGESKKFNHKPQSTFFISTCY